MSFNISIFKPNAVSPSKGSSVVHLELEIVRHFISLVSLKAYVSLRYLQAYETLVQVLALQY